jgi:hypothetical protein
MLIFSMVWAAWLAVAPRTTAVIVVAFGILVVAVIFDFLFECFPGAEIAFFVLLLKILNDCDQFAIVGIVFLTVLQSQ